MVVVNRQKEKSVGEFLAGYSNASTRKSYIGSLRKFFKFQYPELKELYPKKRRMIEGAFEKFDKRMNELSLEYIKADTDIEAELIEYRESLDMTQNSVAVVMAPLFKYLEVNNLEFTKDWKKNLIGKTTHRGVSRERVPTPDELKRILYNLPPQGRIVVRMLATGGMRPDEALTLTLTDLELDYVASYMGEDRQVKSVQIPKVNIRAVNAKTGEPRHTYLTMESRVELDKWLGQNREIYLMRVRKFKDNLISDESFVFPFGYTTLRSLWITALKKSGLYEKDPNTGRITMRLHNLRKFFRTWGGWSNPDVAKCLMGHEEGIDAIYSRQDQAERLLVEGFKGVEANLTIGSQVVIETPSEDMRELKNWNRQLRTEVEEWKEDVKALREAVDGLTKYIDMLEDIYGERENLTPDYPIDDIDKTFKKQAEEPN